jgi:hypothetical protein
LCHGQVVLDLVQVLLEGQLELDEALLDGFDAGAFLGSQGQAVAAEVPQLFFEQLGALAPEPLLLSGVIEEGVVEVGPGEGLDPELLEERLALVRGIADRIGRGDVF